MIRTASEYESAKEYINRDMEFYDYALSEKMTSQEYNLYFQDTEYYFDVLYEKLREIEDIIDYLEYYGSAKIQNMKDEIKKQENILSRMVSEYNNENYISEAVVWNQNPVSELTDRDGQTIPAAEITKDYTVTSSGIRSNHQKIKSMTKTCNTECYSDNLNRYHDKNSYISMYRLDKPMRVEEILEISISKPDDFTLFEFETVNCDLIYLGKNEKNNICIKLVCNNMTKNFENFDYDIYKESALDSIEKLDKQKKTDLINDDQTNFANNINRFNSQEYINKVKKYQDTKEINQEKSDTLHDYAADLNK